MQTFLGMAHVWREALPEMIPGEGVFPAAEEMSVFLQRKEFVAHHSVHYIKMMVSGQSRLCQHLVV
jgi:hypothetical protein